MCVDVSVRVFRQKERERERENERRAKKWEQIVIGNYISFVSVCELHKLEPATKRRSWIDRVVATPWLVSVAE